MANSSPELPYKIVHRLTYPLGFVPYSGIVYERGDASLPPTYHRREAVCLASQKLHFVIFNYEVIWIHLVRRLEATIAKQLWELVVSHGLETNAQTEQRDGGEVARLTVWDDGKLRSVVDLSGSDRDARFTELRERLDHFVDQQFEWASNEAKRRTGLPLADLQRLAVPPDELDELQPRLE